LAALLLHKKIKTYTVITYAFLQHLKRARGSFFLRQSTRIASLLQNGKAPSIFEQNVMALAQTTAYKWYYTYSKKKS